eukprot:2818445-Rhodomonas_salina.1
MLPIDIDRESPNADVRVLSVEDNPSPAVASIPEIMITMSVLAHNADFAKEIIARITKLQVPFSPCLLCQCQTSCSNRAGRYSTTCRQIKYAPP